MNFTDSTSSILEEFYHNTDISDSEYDEPLSSYGSSLGSGTGVGGSKFREDLINEDKNHNLDEEPKSFLRMSNIDTDLFDKNCKFDKSTNRFKIPEIPMRCFLRWKIGRLLASGQGAVVFESGFSSSNQSCMKVARISQFRTETHMENFRRDVEVRYILSCMCKDVSIASLTDAFICKSKNIKYGVSISDKYDSNAIQYLLGLPCGSRGVFLEQFKITMINTIKKMHGCGFVHRDIEASNILVRTTPNGKVDIALTDFETAGSKEYFGWSDHAMDAYISLDLKQVKRVVKEMRDVDSYLKGNPVVLPRRTLLVMGITTDMLDKLKKA